MHNHRKCWHVFLINWSILILRFKRIPFVLKIHVYFSNNYWKSLVYKRTICKKEIKSFNHFYPYTKEWHFIYALKSYAKLTQMKNCFESFNYILEHMCLTYDWYLTALPSVYISNRSVSTVSENRLQAVMYRIPKYRSFAKYKSKPHIRLFQTIPHCHFRQYSKACCLWFIKPQVLK